MLIIRICKKKHFCQSLPDYDVSTLKNTLIQVQLYVDFPPTIWISHQLVGVESGANVCRVPDIYHILLKT